MQNYQYNKRLKNGNTTMRKTLLVILVLTLLTLYGLVIWAWWIEGNMSLYPTPASTAHSL